MNDIEIVAIGIPLLLGFMSLLVPIARRVHLPYTVLLAVLGVALGFAAAQEAGASSLFGQFLRLVQTSFASGEALLTLFLPVLLFSAGLTVDVRRMIDDLAPITVMAGVAVVICTLIVGFLVHPFTEAGLVAALLLGAIVATTDTAAVVAIFRDIGAPRRLSVLIEGESLFNDAAAIATVAVLLGLLSTDQSMTAADGIVMFVLGLLGGGAFGYLSAWLLSRLIGRLRHVVLTEITLTVALAYGTFIFAETILGVSGVIAVVTAAIVIASEGRTRLSPDAWNGLGTIWGQLDFWATSLIFVLAAMYVPSVIEAATPSDLLVIFVLTVATLIARAVIVFCVMPLLSAFQLSAPMALGQKTVLWWGALRGAVTVALALAVGQDTSIDPEVRRFVLVSATGFVLFTLLIKAPTLRPLMAALRLNQLTPIEGALRSRTIASSRELVAERVSDICRRLNLSHRLMMDPATGSEESASDLHNLSDEQLVEFGFLTLALREDELYLEFFERNFLDYRIVEMMRVYSSRIIDGARSEGIEGYQSAAHRFVDLAPDLKRALWIQRNTGWSYPLAGALANYFERLLVGEFVLNTLIDFNDENVRALVGEANADRLETTLLERREGIQNAVKALQFRYPNFASALARRYVSRISLVLEFEEYRRRLGQSLISREVFDDLEAGWQERYHHMDGRPDLDLGLQLRQMLENVPMFKDLDEKEVQKLARFLRPQLAIPNEAIVNEGETGRSMYFIASGTVEVLVRRRPIKLMAGEFFGEMALLGARKRNATVRSIGYTHLLVIHQSDFQKLLKNNPTMRDHIEQIAEDRAIINRAARTSS